MAVGYKHLNALVHLMGVFKESDIHRNHILTTDGIQHQYPFCPWELLEDLNYHVFFQEFKQNTCIQKSLEVNQTVIFQDKKLRKDLCHLKQKKPY